jgi:hypothetical protein
MGLETKVVVELDVNFPPKTRQGLVSPLKTSILVTTIFPLVGAARAVSGLVPVKTPLTLPRVVVESTKR